MDSCDASAEDSSSSVVSDDDEPTFHAAPTSPCFSDDQDASIATLRPTQLPLLFSPKPRLRTGRSFGGKQRPWSLIHLQPFGKGGTQPGAFSHSEGALHKLAGTNGNTESSGFISQTQTPAASTPMLESPLTPFLLTPSPKKQDGQLEVSAFESGYQREDGRITHR